MLEKNDVGGKTVGWGGAPGSFLALMVRRPTAATCLTVLLVLCLVMPVLMAPMTSQAATESPMRSVEVEETPDVPEQVAPQTTAEGEAGTYLDPLYGYTLELPPGWTVSPTAPDALFGAAVLFNYDRDEVERTGHVPDRALKIQIGMGPIGGRASFADWVDWRISEETILDGLAATEPEAVRIGRYEGVAFVLSGPSHPPVLEIDFPVGDDQVMSIGLLPTQSPSLNAALGMLTKLSVPLGGPEGRQPDSVGDAQQDQQVTLPENLLASLDGLAASTCPAGTFPGNEAPNSPIELWMPFRDGETWTVGGAGSYFGNGYHCNMYNDYYATDWNRTGDDGAAVLPAANGTISYAVSPPCPTTGYGCRVQVDHGSGIRTLYGHLSNVYRTSGGVNHWDQIGTVGSTGNSTGPHLHVTFQKLDGQYYSHCWNSGNTCPNGESPLSPQSPKPSPINTTSGAQALLDGHSYTSNNKEPATTCPQSGGVILYWNNLYNCSNSEGDPGYRQTTSTGAWNISDVFNEKASSLKVPSGWSVMLFKDPNRGGSSACRSSDDDDFAGNTFVDGSSLNDNVSCFEVFGNSNCSPYPVTLYPDHHYTGAYCGTDSEGCFYCSGLDNAASSVRVWPGWSVRVYQERSCGGTSRCFTGNDYEFADNTFEDGTQLNDQISSFRVCHNTSCCVPPSTPSAPSPSSGATGVSVNVDLDWADAANASSYDVYFGTSSSPPYVGSTSSSYYNLGTLSYYTHYYWKVVAKSACGESSSSVWDFTTQCLTPGTAGSPSPSDNATGVSVNADLDWADAANATSYDVYFGTSSSPPYVGGTSSSGYTLSTLSQGTQYYWKIVAKNACGQTSTGPVWDFTTQCLTPGTPSSPSPAAGATCVSVNADLDWADSANATSYDVYFGTSSSPPYVGSNTSSSYTLSTLSQGTRYYWKIVAKNACGQTSTGPVWDFTTQPPVPGTPGSPSPSDNATGVSVNADLDWANAANASSYDVYFGTSSDPPYYGNTSSSSYSLPPLSYYTHYYWKIVAKNSCGQTTTGPIWDFTTQCGTPGTPSSPSPSDNATGVSVDADLDWTDAANATSYDLYFGTSSNPGYYGNTSSSSYTLTTLGYYTHYYWKVVAKNACGQTTAGSIWDFTTQCGTPGTPSSPSPADDATGVSVNADLDWADVSSAVSYDVYFGTSSDPPYYGNTTSSAYSLLSLSYGTHYYWKIVAKNACGQTTTGPIWDFTTQCLAPGTPGSPSPADNATGVSVNADLDWANAANTTSYDVYFGTSSDPPYDGSTSSSSYSLPALSYDTHYYWKVVAKNDCGQTTGGPVWDFVTTCAMPDAPSGPSPSDNATGVSLNADLDWGDASYATSYDVYFGTSSNPPYHGNTSSSDYTLPTLSYYTHYYWKIVARNACGSIDGPIWDFTTQCLAPGAPSSPSPADSATGVSINADLDWADAASATSYDVHFGTSSNPPYVGSTTSSSYALPSLSFGTPYYWKVVAKNACGESAASPVWSFNTSEARLVFVPLAMRNFVRGSPPPTPTPTPCPAPPIEDLSFNPASPANVGTTVHIHAKATWNSCFRAMRLRIDGQAVYELGSPEFTWDWNTLGYAPGDHVVRLEVAGQGDNSWSNPSVRQSTYHLTSASVPAIHGQVTQDGAPAVGVPVDLRFYDGDAASTFATAQTDSSGAYRFTEAPSLSSGESYYLRYLNTAGTPGRLRIWVTSEITSYVAGTDVAVQDFDIGDVPLLSPSNGEMLTLPYAFYWTPRPATASDDYEFDLIDPADYDPWWWTEPTLGYVGSYTLNALPSGFSPGTEYAWEVWLWGPNGWGVSREFGRRVTFANAGSGGALAVPAEPRLLPEDLEDSMLR